jgi:biopolymer transport protein ExbD
MKFLKADQQDGVGVSLTPLVDIIFLLIIFFLVSSTFEKGEKTLGIQLPTTQGDNAKNQDPKSWVIGVSKSSEIYYQGQKSSFEEVEKILKRNKGRQDEIEIVLKADEEAPYGIVASFIGLLKQNGYSRVSFRTLEIKKT